MYLAMSFSFVPDSQLEGTRFGGISLAMSRSFTT